MARPSRARAATLIPAIAGIVLLASGCWTPVGVSRISPQTAYRVETESALSAGQPSEPSKIALRRLGLLDWFDEEPAAVLSELHRELGPSGYEDRLFALADLSFLHAERTGDRAHCLASEVYAYALLFPGEGKRVQLHRSDPRLRLACDLYNQGLAQGLTVSREAQGPAEDGNDGVVAYRSAHIDEAVSELVVRSPHSCQGKPETIEEIRRILLEHAAAQGVDRP